ncbi:MAG: hypothetical protein WDA18_06560 [Candidatus Ratteibacteria bacterium]
MKISLWKRGFTAVELLTVAAAISAMSAGGYAVVKKGHDMRCLNNLKQIGLAVELFVADHGTLPKAKFFATEKNDPQAITSLLKPYITASELFYCPALAREFQKYPTNYLWNDTVNGKNPDTLRAGTWLMTEATSLNKELDSPHTGGFGTLFVDGSAKITRAVPFPKLSVQKETPLDLAPSKLVPVPVEQPAPFIEKSSPTLLFQSYQIPKIPSSVEAGAKATFSFYAFGEENRLFESNALLSIFDLTGTVSPKEVALVKGVWEGELTFTSTHPENTLFLSDEEGRWATSKSFSVISGPPVEIYLSSPSYIQAGSTVNFLFELQDSFGNPVTKSKNISLFPSIGDEAEFPPTLVEKDGKFSLPVLFHKSGETVLSIRDSNSLKKEFTVRVSPGPIDRFEISGLPDSLTAGLPYQITVQALDKYGNRAKGFSPVDRSSVSYTREDTSSGMWLETVSFTKSAQDLFFTIEDGMGHSGTAGPFNILPGPVSRILLDQSSYFLLQGQELTMPFFLEDAFGNPVEGIASDIIIQGKGSWKVQSKEKGGYLLQGAPLEKGKQSVMITIKNILNLSQKIEILHLPPQPILKEEFLNP